MKIGNLTVLALGVLLGTSVFAQSRFDLGPDQVTNATLSTINSNFIIAAPCLITNTVISTGVVTVTAGTNVLGGITNNIPAVTNYAAIVICNTGAGAMYAFADNNPSNLTTTTGIYIPSGTCVSEQIDNAVDTRWWYGRAVSNTTCTVTRPSHIP